MEFLSSIVGSVVRHALTGVGMYLIGKGWVSEADWTSLLGVIVVAVSGLLWSIYQKWKASKNPPTPA